MPTKSFLNDAIIQASSSCKDVISSSGFTHLTYCYLKTLLKALHPNTVASQCNVEYHFLKVMVCKSFSDLFDKDVVTNLWCYGDVMDTLEVTDTGRKLGHDEPVLDPISS